MKQDKYASPLQAAKQQGDDRLEPMIKELESLRNKIEASGGPQNARDDIVLFQQKQQVFQQAQQQLERDFDRLVSQTNNSAFLTVAEAAQRVAAAKGYSHVFSTRPTEPGNGPETQLQFTLGVLARPVIVFPREDDITEAVITELRLP